MFQQHSYDLLRVKNRTRLLTNLQFKAYQSTVILLKLVGDKPMGSQFPDEILIVLLAEDPVQLGESRIGVFAGLDRGIQAKETALRGDGQLRVSLTSGCRVLYNGKRLSWLYQSYL